MNSILDIAKNMSITHNVSFNIYDEITGKLVQHHEGHNAATNSMLTGIGHYLIGDGVLNQGHELLEQWIPKYISLGTMGLCSQDLDDNGLPVGIGPSVATTQEQEIANFQHYMNFTPGFGADGYDWRTNPDGDRGYTREFMGLGPMFGDRYDKLHEVIRTRNNNKTFSVQHRIYKLLSVTVDGVDKLQSTTFSNDTFTLQIAPGSGKTIIVDYQSKAVGWQTTNCELISDTFPRAEISYRKIIPEEYSELPKTIDLIFSAMISTGAMKQFREKGKNYVLVSEAGLWSRKTWPKDSEGNIDYNSGNNGLLAGYRIYPPNEDQQDMTVDANRRILKEQILRVGYNQVVQVVWKIQLGSVGELVNYIKEPTIWKGFDDE